MDRLARNAMLAKQAGMSYGQWKAMQPIVTVEPETEAIPKGMKRCEYCDELFLTRSGKRFCDEYCRQRAYWDKNRELKRDYMRRRREEERNGKA